MNLPLIVSISLSFSPINHFCLPLSSSTLANSVVNFLACSAISPECSLAFTPINPNPAEVTRCFAASPSNTVTLVFNFAISSTAANNSARLTPSSVSRIFATCSDDTSSCKPGTKLLNPAFSANIVSFSIKCCATICRTFSSS